MVLMMLLMLLITSSPLCAADPEAIFSHARTGQFEKLKGAIDDETDIDALDEHGNSVLHYAAQHNHHEMVHYLLFEEGASYQLLNANEMTPVHIAIQSGHGLCVKYFLENGAWLDPQRKPYIEIALEGGEVNSCKPFFLHDPEVDESPGFLNPLHYCAGQGFTECASWIMNNAPEQCTNNFLGRNPLHTAYRTGHVHTAKTLKVKCSSLSSRDKKGRLPQQLLRQCKTPLKKYSTTLFHAAKHNILKLAKWLLEFGTEPTERDEWGRTPLHYAAEAHDAETNDCSAMIDLLIAHGADPTAQDQDAVAPRDICKLTYEIETVQIPFVGENGNSELVEWELVS